MKPIIKKCVKSGADIDRALQNVQATPLDASLPSPAELMFNRPIATTLSSRAAELAPEVYRDHLCECHNAQKAFADQRTKQIPPLLTGQAVHILDKERKVCYPGRITAQNRNRCYEILTEGRQCITRNCSHLKSMTPPPATPQAEAPTPSPASRAPSQTPEDQPSETKNSKMMPSIAQYTLKLPIPTQG